MFLRCPHRWRLLIVLAVLLNGVTVAPGAAAQGPVASWRGVMVVTGAAPAGISPGGVGEPAAFRLMDTLVAASVGRTFRLPLPPPAVILNSFRPPAHRYGAGHRGVDLAGTVGAPVLAAGAGTVVFAGPLAGRGVVSIQHSSGIRTTYEPVTASVATGSSVALGQPIGTLQAGHPPCAPAVCLHWGARLPDGSYLDPMSLIDGLRVRLLPWAGDG